MKKFILAFVFLIGLMVSLPSTSSGSSSPPGQVSFSVDQIDIAPAIAIVQVPVFVSEFNQLAPVTEMVQEKGGAAIENSIITSRAVGYCNKNVIVSTTDFTMITDYALKTYFLYKVDLAIKNNVGSHRFARDGLRCRV